MASCGGIVHVPVPQEPDARAARAQATGNPSHTVLCLVVPLHALLVVTTNRSVIHSVAVLNRAAFHLANAKWRAATYTRNKRACKRLTCSETVSE